MIGCVFITSGDFFKKHFNFFFYSFTLLAICNNQQLRLASIKTTTPIHTNDSPKDYLTKLMVDRIRIVFNNVFSLFWVAYEDCFLTKGKIIYNRWYSKCVLSDWNPTTQLPTANCLLVICIFEAFLYSFHSCLFICLSSLGIQSVGWSYFTIQQLCR